MDNVFPNNYFLRTIKEKEINKATKNYFSISLVGYSNGLSRPQSRVGILVQAQRNLWWTKKGFSVVSPLGLLLFPEFNSTKALYALTPVQFHLFSYSLTLFFHIIG